jgi:hypothetical protein
VQARLAAALAIGALLLRPVPGMAQTNANPDANWRITLTELALNGRVIGKATPISCPRDGCNAPLSLTVGDTPRRFLVAFTFVQRGAYLSLQALTPEPGKVIGFEDGYQGPIFVAVRGPHEIQTLNFTLTGVAETDPNTPALMNNAQSLVFHRKMNPDLTLKVDLARPAPKG